MLSELASAGIFYLKFSDIRDADKAYAKVESIREKWNAQHIGAKQFAVKHQPECLKYLPISMFEGQILVTAHFAGPRQRFDAGSIGHLIKELLENYGDVMAYEVGIVRAPTATYRAEYYNATVVDNALANLNGFKIGVSYCLFFGCLQRADRRRCAL